MATKTICTCDKCGTQVGEEDRNYTFLIRTMRGRFSYAEKSQEDSEKDVMLCQKCGAEPYRNLCAALAAIVKGTP